VTAANAVRVLGVLFTLKKHVITTVSAKCFYQLRQLCRMQRSLDRESAATLVHTFVTSQLDCGNALLMNVPRTMTDKLQWVLNAIARVITGTWKVVGV